MTAREAIPRQGARKTSAGLAFWLAAALTLPGSSLALPSDGSDIELEAQRRADAPAVSSVFDQPSSPAPIVVVRPPPETPESAPQRTPSANPLWAIPLATLSTTRERPIFSPSRRPPPPVVAPVAIENPPPPPPKPPRVERPELSLVGTIAGDEESFGIFVDQTTKAPLRLKIGEAYQGWKLLAVQSREVTLGREQQTTILSLPPPGATAPGQPRAKTESAAIQRPAEPPPQRDDRRR
jgi:general secretion pathway protein N